MYGFIKLSTGKYPCYTEDIANDPDGFGDYAYIHPTKQPEIDLKTQRCVLGQPIKVDDAWHATWVVRDATPEEIELEKRRFEPRITNV